MPDISGSNMAFTSRKLARLSTKSMFEIIGTPKYEKLVRLDGKPLSPGMPGQLIEKANWDVWVDEDEEDVRIIDLGEAFAHGAEPKRLAEPGDLQVPEIIFTGSFDYRVDLWRAGCTVSCFPGGPMEVKLIQGVGQIYTLVMGSRPFWYMGDVNNLVKQMIGFVEELPAEWEPEWERLRGDGGGDDIPGMTRALTLPSGTNTSTNLSLDSSSTRSELEERFANRAVEPSLERLLPIIQGLMRFRPSDRISAAEALALIDD